MTTNDIPGLSLQTAGTGLAYRRDRVSPGIVHLGVGAFHRAHMAVYVDDLLKTDPSCGIVGASLRRSETRDALAAQDFLYTVLTRSSSETSTRIIGSILDVLVAEEQRRELIAVMCNPDTRIVSLTVTEKGYCHDPATGNLRTDHPDILHDLADPGNPVSAPGLIVRTLQLRRAAGIDPFTVLSCDNLPANGETTQKVLTQFAELRGAELADFISGKVCFPSTMVDRIVPSTTDEDRDLVAEATGFRDAWPVVTEPFSQWVVEDRFSTGRPAFETVGVEMVSDVKPYELMKLRMLNGSHSSLAYLGYLAGFRFVSEAIAEPSIGRFISSLMTEEVMPTLPPALGNLSSYRDALLQRFANPALKHRTWQIAMDGSQKLPQRLLETIRARLSKNQSIRLAALGVAAWMRYVTGKDERGETIDIRDPLETQLRSVSAAAGDNPEQLVAGFLQIREVFGEDLPHNEIFRSVLREHLSDLLKFGALQTVRRIMTG